MTGFLGFGHVLSRGVARFGRLRFLWEEDQAGFVGLQTLDVGGKGFLAEILAAGVDGDADCGSEFAGNAGFLSRNMSACCAPIPGWAVDISHLQLSERDATPSAHATVVLDGRAADDGPQLVDGAGRELDRLLGAGSTACLLFAGLGRTEGGQEEFAMCTTGATALGF